MKMNFKKFLPIIFMGLLLLLIQACTNPPDVVDPNPPVVSDPEPEDSKPDINEDLPNFSFDDVELSGSAMPGVVPQDSTLLSVEPSVIKKGEFVDLVVSYGHESLENKYGEQTYYLEVYHNGRWHDTASVMYDFVPGKYWGTLRYFSSEKAHLWEPATQTIPLTTAYKNLPVGRYRILKDVDGWKSVEFVIQDPESDYPVIPEPTEFTFDVSKLTPTKYPDAVENKAIVYCEPSVAQKENMEDLVLYVCTTDHIFAGGYSEQVRNLEVLIDGVWYDALGLGIGGSKVWEDFVPYDYAGYMLFDLESSGSVDFDGYKYSWKVPLTTIFKNLPVGTYRFVIPWGNMYAEFTIE
ncbi:MAG: hypothetical protein IJP09_01555 [Clostridia bacterium]|nr:hypothetical protein [Clostridia bacterium]